MLGFLWNIFNAENVAVSLSFYSYISFISQLYLWFCVASHSCCKFNWKKKGVDYKMQMTAY